MTTVDDAHTVGSLADELMYSRRSDEPVLAYVDGQAYIVAAVTNDDIEHYGGKATWLELQPVDPT